MAISNVMSNSLISANCSIKAARMQNGIKKQMEDRGGVLESEIKQEKGNAPEKQKELEKIEKKAAKVENMTIDTLSEANTDLMKAAKEDQEKARSEKGEEKKKDISHITQRRMENMSMNVGTDYSANKAGFTSVDIPQVEKGDSEENRKWSASVKPEYGGVVYNRSEEPIDNSTYSINKMSASDRTAIVNQLKADAEERKNQMMNLVQKTLSGQIGTFGKASGDDLWRTLASGKFAVDAATKAQAQEDISEDGYWGVKKTSQRLFDFASALAGDDVDKMKEMQAAMEKGFKQATKAWGRELPEISRNTLNAANKLFEDYFASKQSAETGSVPE